MPGALSAFWRRFPARGAGRASGRARRARAGARRRGRSLRRRALPPGGQRGRPPPARRDRPHPGRWHAASAPRRDARRDRSLCRLLTRVKFRAAKGKARARLADLEGETRGLLCLTGGEDGPLAADLRRGPARGGPGDARAPGRPVRPRPASTSSSSATCTRDEERWTAPARRAGRRAAPPGRGDQRRPLRDARRAAVLDVLTAVRQKTTLDEAGRRLEPNAERHG